MATRFPPPRFIRETFARMAMNDEETVALIARRPHLRQDPRRRARVAQGPGSRGRRPRGAGPGLGQQLRHRHGADAIGSGLEVTWTQTPAQWSNHFFENLFKYEWVQTRAPAGAIQWEAKDAEDVIPDAHDPSKKHKPTMLTTDLSLRFDPAYEKISRRFLREPAGLRRGLRPRLVQADPSRHGPARRAISARKCRRKS